MDVVTVMPLAQGGIAAVMQLRAAPQAAPLPDDAVTVIAADTAVPTLTRPLLSRRSPLALVIDTSQASEPALPQTVSGAVSLLLRQQSDAPVVVVADRSPPQVLTPQVTTQLTAVRALNDLRPGGSPSTSAALALADQRLPHVADVASLVVLSTAGAAPAASEAGQIVDRWRASRTVLSVVETSKEAESWSSVATATGGVGVRSTGEAAAAAFDDMDSTLQARYLVIFTPPAGATSVDLRVLSAGRTLTAHVPLNGRVEPPPTASAPGSSSGRDSSHPSPLPWLVVAGLTVVVVAVALLRFQRRRGDSAASATGRTGSDRLR